MDTNLNYNFKKLKDKGILKNIKLKHWILKFRSNKFKKNMNVNLNFKKSYQKKNRISNYNIISLLCYYSTFTSLLFYVFFFIQKC
ncbi:hypothetical protein M918_11830 [Clostridium sp. BL8]|nr:hypothetical protein M918_11830 [Clostridium sp. BL8]